MGEPIDIETIKQQLENSVKDMFGRNEVSPRMLSNMREALKIQLSQVGGIKDSKVETPVQLWETWSLKQQATWFWRNKITNEANRYRNSYYDFFMVLNELTPDFHLDFYRRITLPYWALENPKSIYVVGVLLQPVYPLETVQISFKI